MSHITAHSPEVAELIQSLGIDLSLNSITEVHLAIVAGREVELTITRLVPKEDFSKVQAFVEQFNLVKK